MVKKSLTHPLSSLSVSLRIIPDFLLYFGEKLQENKTLGFEKLHEIAVGTARGIAYLHEEFQQRIIHYDIKPGNILLDSNLCPKVADFGLAKLCNRENTHITMTGGRGTPGYAALELWMPFLVGELIITCGIEEQYEEIAERMVKVALSCVHYKPKSRPEMSVVVKMLEGSGSNLERATPIMREYEIELASTA
ncbi:Serine/threonine-protein kinase, active site [Sesbania bispinosa]|nr:Serine/threonine-protein kinase, active site [Sesbania bispinosa]